MDNTCKDNAAMTSSNDKQNSKVERKRKILEVLSRPFKTILTGSRRTAEKQRTCRPTQTFRANFSLEDIRGSRFPGRQSTATALCALLQAKCLSPSSWSPQVLDRLLLQGDKLHSTRLHHLGKLVTGDGSLSIKELPTDFSSRHREFNIKITDIMKHKLLENKGNWKTELNLQRMISLLKSQMKRCIRDGSDGILLSGEGTVAVMADGSHHYIFHPCFVRRKRFHEDKQEAVLWKFCDIDRMFGFLLAKFYDHVIHGDVVAVDILAETDRWSNLTLAHSDHSDSHSWLS